MEENDDFGLGLLMNQRKKAGSDSASIISGGDSGSVKSFRVNEPLIRQLDVEDDEDDGVGSGSYEEEDDDAGIGFYQDSGPQKPQQQQYWNYGSAGQQKRPETPGGSEMISIGSHVQTGRMSEAEIIDAKRELLYQFDRLEKKGKSLPRKFTMSSSLEEMRNEYDRIKRDTELDGSIKFQRKALTALVAGIEFLNGKFDPLGAKLDGWSENINDNIDDYDDVFEELHDKYKGKAKMAPELKLLMMMAGSGFMVHMTNSMFKNFPGADQVFKKNPELARQFAAATAETVAEQNKGGMFEGLGNMFSGMFSSGGGGGKPGGNDFVPPQPSTPQQRPSMKGPSNVDEILRELNIPPVRTNDNDRIEMMSTVTDSELGDDHSINGLLMNSKKNRKRSGGITLDI